MIWIVVGVTTILSCELFSRIPIISSFLEIKSTASKSLSVLKNDSISDHWKEWILPKYAFKISRYSILFFLYLTIAICPFFLVAFFSIFIDSRFFKLILEPLPIVGITIFAWVYLVLRRKWGCLINFKNNESTSKYNCTSKLLHYLAINSNIRCEILFDIEKLNFLKKIKSSTGDRHVFVCGLARSGTTVLMRALYQSDKFSSLTYRDMPFVLAPNIWSKIANKYRKPIQKMTRAHGDGILVDFDSPEALEEVFWRVFAGKEYIRSTYLVPHETDEALITAFQNYIALINFKYSKERYLSKNNNNILRLNSITKAFPNAIVFVPFRDPLQQSFSLLKQHQNFIIKHREDKFTEKYMSWLVHHEFGLDHRPFRFGDDNCQYHDISSIDYWLYLWINTYTYLLERLKKSGSRIFPVSYEDVCRKDRILWQKLSYLAEIPLDNNYEFVLKNVNVPIPVNDNLKNKAYEIYLSLLTESRMRISFA